MKIRSVLNGYKIIQSFSLISYKLDRDMAFNLIDYEIVGREAKTGLNDR